MRTAEARKRRGERGENRAVCFHTLRKLACAGTNKWRQKQRPPRNARKAQNKSRINHVAPEVCAALLPTPAACGQHSDSRPAGKRIQIPRSPWSCSSACRRDGSQNAAARSAAPVWGAGRRRLIPVSCFLVFRGCFCVDWCRFTSGIFHRERGETRYSLRSPRILSVSAVRFCFFPPMIPPETPAGARRAVDHPHNRPARGTTPKTAPPAWQALRTSP
jgi:hypothetical protein